MARWLERGLTVLVVVAAMLLLTASARADEVTSKGTKLRGKVTGLTSTGLNLEPEYGSGVVFIKWEDVDDVYTDGDIQVLRLDDTEVIAPVKGKSGEVITVGQETVEVATIHSAVAIGPDGPGWRDRMRSRFRFWDGHFDLGYALQRSTIDTRGLSIGFETTRYRAPTRLIIGSSYRYGTEDKKGTPETTTQNELKGWIRLEYDLTERLYVFGSADGEYDEIEKLSIRTVPKAGVGYAIFLETLDEKRQNFLKAEAGPGWVYQKYFGGVEDDYWTVAFGLLAKYYLPYDSVFDFRFDYLPAVDDWANNYLLRTTTSLTVPLLDPISFKAALMDEYNNQPAAGADHNSLFITIGLSVGW